MLLFINNLQLFMSHYVINSLYSIDGRVVIRGTCMGEIQGSSAHVLRILEIYIILEVDRL